jgi:hypothetical protein
VAEISIGEVEVICNFLSATVPLLAALPAIHLHALLRDSRVEVLEGGDTPPPLYTCGELCNWCTVILQGRLHTRVQCGSEAFEGEQGPWSTLAVAALSEERYVADFTARPIERTRVLRLSRESFQIVSKVARQEVAEELKADAARRAARRQAPAPPRMAVESDSTPPSREAASPRSGSRSPYTRSPPAEPILIELAPVKDLPPALPRGPSLGKLQLHF